MLRLADIRGAWGGEGEACLQDQLDGGPDPGQMIGPGAKNIYDAGVVLDSSEQGVQAARVSEQLATCKLPLDINRRSSNILEGGRVEFRCVSRRHHCA